MSLPETVQFHKITVQEFHALYPYLDPNRPHELLDGQILVMPIPGHRHSVIRNHLYQEFFRQGCPGLHVWPGGLRLSEVTELWPDLTLLGRDPDRGPDNPTAADARLVVEVAYETLGLDTGPRQGPTSKPGCRNTGSLTCRAAACCGTWRPTIGARCSPTAARRSRPGRTPTS